MEEATEATRTKTSTGATEGDHGAWELGQETKAENVGVRSM